MMVYDKQPSLHGEGV